MLSSHITHAIFVAIIAILSSTTNAQLSTLPKRYRSNKVQQTSSITTVKHTLKQHETKKNGNLRKKRYLRKDELNYMSMNNLFTTSMSFSMPNLEEARFDIPDLDFMSMPLEEARFDIPIGSMPLNVFDIEPDTSDGDNMMSVGLGKSSSSSDTLILASMLAGLSALVVGSAAVFMKMRKVHSGQCIEDRLEEEEEMELQRQQQQLDPEDRVVSFASKDELYHHSDEHPSDESEEYDNVQDLPLY